MLNLILAVSENYVIGKNGKLPWHIPEDLKRFKALTLGHKLICGRKTYESLPDLPDRQVFALGRGLNTVDDVLHIVGEEPSYVIGGAMVAEFFISEHLIDKVYLTVVHKHVDGDCFMHKDTINKIYSEFTLTEQIDRDGYSFLTFDKKL